MSAHTEEWDFYLTYFADIPASIIVDLARAKTAPHAELPVRMNVRFLMQTPREDGLSTNEERQALDEAEEVLTKAVTGSQSAKFVGRIIHRGIFDLVFYAPENSDLDGVLSRLANHLAPYSADCTVEDDADWNFFFDILYPSPVENQQIMNRRVLETLQEHGDSLTQPREVCHWIYFPDSFSRSQFVERIAEGKFEVEESESESPEEGEETARRFGVQLRRQDAVDFSSINALVMDLFLTAEECQGEYDGWECAVVKGMPESE